MRVACEVRFTNLKNDHTDFVKFISKVQCMTVFFSFNMLQCNEDENK